MSNNLDAISIWSLSSTKLVQFFRLALNHHLDGGRQYFPPDLSPVPQGDESDVVKAKLQELITLYAPQFAKSSVPFWNPDYIAHTNLDQSMPGIVRYLTALLFNPNNIALEASPLTPILRIKVGTQLCDMVGYNTDVHSKPVAQGHFTSGIAVANLESMWAARNLKFYPLSLRNAMHNELSFLADSFKVPTCDGTQKLLRDFTNWELLNINLPDILDIPDRFCSSSGLSSSFLENSLKPYLIHAVGKDKLEKDFNITTSTVYIAGATMHYSWEKSADIIGIGSANILTVGVDNAARMDMTSLDKHLENCLSQGRAVYAVVAVVGSAEHGSCDPLKEIIRIRKKYREKGLSFVLHADAAWGAYFATACPPTTTNTSGVHLLKQATVETISQLYLCDSITIDPHNCGYIQYQAGALVYRDERMRRFVTCMNPIVFKKEPKGTEVSGIEESNLGAAPVVAYFFHKVIGLNEAGYGQLLGQASFNALKMYAHLVSMKDPSFIVTTFDMLPSEKTGDDVETEKAHIADLLSRSYREGDRPLMELAGNIGSDLCINAFAVNFRLRNGQVNNVVAEANNLGERVFKRLSVSSQQTDLATLPLILTSTQLAQSKYGACLTNFKTRLGLEGHQDLFVLLNVVTSPIPTSTLLLAEITSSLRHIINDECQISLYRNTLALATHRFLMQGTDTIFLVYFSMFNMENHRTQLVITGQLPREVVTRYVRERARDPAQVFTLVSANQETLDHVLQRKDFHAVIHKGIPNHGDEPIVKGFKLTNISILFQAPLGARYLKPYPRLSMPFLIYGTAQQRHITHLFTAYPNAHLSADQIVIQGYAPEDGRLFYAHLNYCESAAQPFASTFPVVPETFFFRSDAMFTSVKFTSDPDGKTPLGTGTINLTKNVYVDTHWLNMDPLPPGRTAPVTPEQNWNDIIDGIENEISKGHQLSN